MIFDGAKISDSSQSCKKSPNLLREFKTLRLQLSALGVVAAAAGDKETEVLKQLNDRVQTDPRVENILLTIRDGLMMCVKL